MIRHLKNAAVLALFAGCVSCGPKPGITLQAETLKVQAAAMAERVKEEFPGGASVLVLVLTDANGDIPETFRIQQAALEEGLADAPYTLTVSGPDLRRDEEREAMAFALHEGWPADLVDSWIRERKADAVVSLVVITGMRRPDWPPIITIEDITDIKNAGDGI